MRLRFPPLSDVNSLATFKSCSPRIKQIAKLQTFTNKRIGFVDGYLIKVATLYIRFCCPDNQSYRLLKINRTAYVFHFGNKEDSNRGTRRAIALLALRRIVDRADGSSKLFSRVLDTAISLVEGSQFKLFAL